MKTYIPKKGEATGKWYLVDASDRVLGRLASRVAAVLRGKHRPDYTPSADLGDHIVVVNAERVRVTGRKMAQKTYYRHSGYPGGLKAETLAKRFARHPEDVVRDAVAGMLPKTGLGRHMIKKLKVYKGAAHRHQAQRPEPLDL
ncbi:MAG: 50S ribosomal protein L13 [Armatimonadetes bacterium]|nr:50S ribosomal protein L13 [Armatimonadota bacterium]